MTSLLLSQAQKNVLEELKYDKDSPKGKFKIANDQLIIQLHKAMNNELTKIWKTDEIITMNLVQGIELVAEAIANVKSPEVFKVMRQILTSCEKDLSNYKIVHKSVKCVAPDKNELIDYAMKMFPDKNKTFFTKMKKSEIQALIGGL